MAIKFRVSRVTTKSGDKGTTALADGTMYPKHDVRIELVGELDEANACLGLAVVCIGDPYRNEIIEIQSRLFDVGAAVAVGETPHDWNMLSEVLSTKLKAINSELSPLREFVLPGSNETSARLHLARTIVRRIERVFWQSDMPELINAGVGQYLNRLSDYLFVLARKTSDDEILWQPLQQEKNENS